MNRRTAAALAVVAALTLTACGTDRQKDCRDPQPVVMIFNSSSGHYHYDSPKGKIVPAKLVPESARKVPGYKAPSAKVAPPPKVDLRKPAPAPAKPAPAAPRGRR
jgi:hypothetical protein